MGHLSENQGAVKLHVGLDADGYLPTFISLSEGKTHESNWANALKLPRGSFVVFDRGFNDYAWYQSLMKNGVFFVTRLKSNAVVAHGPKRSGRKAVYHYHSPALTKADSADARSANRSPTRNHCYQSHDPREWPSATRAVVSPSLFRPQPRLSGHEA